MSEDLWALFWGITTLATVLVAFVLLHRPFVWAMDRWLTWVGVE